MIVPQSEIDLIHGKTERRAMWIPVTRGTLNQRRACPVEVGQCVGLQTAPFKKSTRITIIEPPLLTTLGMMTDADATRQGYYGGVRGAREAWERAYGASTPETEAWAIRFALGNHSAFYADHAERYLKAKMGGGRSYTVLAEQAAHGEGAVPREDELKFAKQARVHREAETHRKLEQTLRTVRAAIADMDGHELDKETREVLRWMRRRAGQLERRLEHAA